MIFTILAVVALVVIGITVIYNTVEYDFVEGVVGGFLALLTSAVVLIVYLAIALFSTGDSNHTETDTSKTLGSFQQYAGVEADPEQDRYLELSTSYGPEQKAKIVLKDGDNWKTVTVDPNLVVVKYGDKPDVVVKHYRSIHPALAPFDLHDYPALYVITIPKTANSVLFSATESAAK
jgi:hypothetical protein